MTSRSARLLALAALMLPQPSYAATGIECMYDGYSAEETAIINGFFANFTLDDDAVSEGGEVLIGPVSAHALKCGGANNWSPDAIEQAKYYQMALLTEAALKSGPWLTADDVRRLDAELAKADKSMFRKLFADRLQIGIEKGGDDVPDISDAEAQPLGQLLVEAGFRLDAANAEPAMMLVITRAFVQLTKENFARE